MSRRDRYPRGRHFTIADRARIALAASGIKGHVGDSGGGVYGCAWKHRGRHYWLVADDCATGDKCMLFESADGDYDDDVFEEYRSPEIAVSVAIDPERRPTSVK